MVTARYDYGVEQRVYLLNATSEEVGATLTELVEAAPQINRSAHTNRF